MEKTPEQLLEEQFQQERRDHLGGTDVAAILGVHPYKSQFEVWLEKTGQGEKWDGNEATDMGTLLEPQIAAKYEKQTGVALEKGLFLKHREYPFFGGHLDYVRKGEEHGVEIKLVGHRSLHRWSEPGPGQLVPEEYYIQAFWYMILTGYPKWDLAAQKEFARKLAIYTLDYDPEFAKKVVEICHQWWDTYVVGNQPPPMGGSKGEDEWLKKTFPVNLSKEIVRLARKDWSVFEQLREAEERKTKLDKEYEALRSEVKRIIGERYGVRGDFFNATWAKAKDSKGTVIDWERLVRERFAYVPSEEDLKAYSREVITRVGPRQLRVDFK